MPEYVEVIYETGAKSVVAVDDRDALFAGLSIHHDRALNGQPGGPAGNPAERIKKVLFYDVHPGEHGADGNISSDEALAVVKDFLKGSDVVNANELAAKIRDMTSSLVDDDPDNPNHPHDSQFRMPEKETVAVEDFFTPPAKGGNS